ncbi:MAG: cytochrome P450 family protein [Pseudonocardiaceae bacterium]
MLVEDGLGRRLQLIQGIQWLHGANGDPYATLLRGFDDDVDAIHQQVRARGPLWRSTTGTWVTADHRLGAEVLSHPGLGPRCRDGLPVPQPRQVMPLTEAFLGIDREEAGRLRDLWGPAFRGKAADRHQPRTEQVCERVLDGVDGQFDVITDVVQQVPVEVLADLFALSEPQRTRLRDDCADAAIALDSLLCPQRLAATRRMLDAVDDLRALFGDLAGGPAVESGDSVLDTVWPTGGDPAPDDVRALGVLLAVVGVHMTANLVASAVAALLAAPELWSATGGDSDRAALAVDETLRHGAPVQMQAAVAHTDLELAGQQVEAGHQVVVLIGAANRDPGAFTDPGRFDLDRATGPKPRPLLPGPPHEVVLPFAVNQAGILLRVLATRFPRLRQSGPLLRRYRAPVTQSLLRFPVSSN